MESKRLRMIGLANKAGKVITGVSLCEKALKRRKAFLLLLAQDAEDSTKKNLLKYNIPVAMVESKAVLGKFTGKEIRSAAVVCDRNFAKVILESEEC